LSHIWSTWFRRDFQLVQRSPYDFHKVSNEEVHCGKGLRKKKLWCLNIKSHGSHGTNDYTILRFISKKVISRSHGYSLEFICFCILEIRNFSSWTSKKIQVFFCIENLQSKNHNNQMLFFFFLQGFGSHFQIKLTICCSIFKLRFASMSGLKVFW
jgi:hypothetical protein